MVRYSHWPLSYDTPSLGLWVLDILCVLAWLEYYLLLVLCELAWLTPNLDLLGPGIVITPHLVFGLGQRYYIILMLHLLLIAVFIVALILFEWLLLHVCTCYGLLPSLTLNVNASSRQPISKKTSLNSMCIFSYSIICCLVNLSALRLGILCSLLLVLVIILSTYA